MRRSLYTRKVFRKRSLRNWTNTFLRDRYLSVQQNVFTLKLTLVLIINSRDLLNCVRQIFKMVDLALHVASYIDLPGSNAHCYSCDVRQPNPAQLPMVRIVPIINYSDWQTHARETTINRTDPPRESADCIVSSVYTHEHATFWKRPVTCTDVAFEQTHGDLNSKSSLTMAGAMLKTACETSYARGREDR